MGQLSNMIQEYVSNGLNWNDSSGSTHANPFDQTNTIQRLPVDIFIEILKLLTLKDAARLTCVCKWLNEIISDDKLWEYFLRNQRSTFFAETKLRYGFPLRTCPLQERSYKHICVERAKVPRAIIIDGGAGYRKFGWSNDPSPSVRLTTPAASAERVPIETKVHDFLTTTYTRMHVSPSAQPVIISTPIVVYDVSRGLLSNVDLCTILFKMEVPAVCLVNQAILALFSASISSGILVNIGHSKTKVYPIINGEIEYKVGVESVGVGGSNLTEYLGEQLSQRNLHFSSLFNVRLLKEELCYVALDYKAELLKDTEALHRIDSSVSYTLKQERFRTGELLFQPQLAGTNERGLHHAVAKCINHCSEKSGHDWFKTIVLAGGTARLPGLAERLEKELQDLLPPFVSSGIRVIASPYGEDAAWHGAKLVSNLSTFTDSWCIERPSKPELERTRE